MCKKLTSPNDCYKKLEEIEFSIQVLFISIDNFLFQDIRYSEVQGLLPQWVIDSGRSPELNISKEDFEKSRQLLDFPIIRKFIYYYDLWNIVSAIQDRFIAVDKFMRDFYSKVPFEVKYQEKDYTSAVRYCGRNEDEVHISLNNVFISLASTFDLLSKLAFEQSHYGKYGDFAKYSKMESAGVIYNAGNLAHRIDPSLTVSGMLFSETKEIRTIETFRNEYVHNGPWDLRSSVYYTAINGEPADVIVFSPDIDDRGNFVSSGARNKFYSQGNMINVMLPTLLMSVLEIIKHTIDQLAVLYKAGTTMQPDDAKTEQCIIEIIECLEKEAEKHTTDESES